MTAAPDLLGDSPGIRAVRARVGQLLQAWSSARRPPPVFIQGETGTGKGLLARALHRGSPRAGAAFVDINCAAVPETLLEAELFGYERGAFTDARQAKPGLFEAANRGTLFLDEIGLLPPALQAKLLSVLEERTVRRLGATRPEPVDVWVIAATNEDLTQALRERRFREDLYHRLAVVTLTLPPLRSRGADVTLLAKHFLTRVAADYGLPPKTLSAEALSALSAYPWPGNIRELSNTLERAALLGDTPVISAEQLALSDPAAAGEGDGDAGPTPAIASSRDAMRRHLEDVLVQTGWNISRAAALLGVARNTVLARIRRFRLTPPDGRTYGRRTDRDKAAPIDTARSVPAAPLHDQVPARWERRYLAFLAAKLEVKDEVRPELGRGTDVIIDKVRSFGGHVQDLSPTAVVAAFGFEAMEDAPSRAALAALAIQKAAERSQGLGVAPAPVKLAVHVDRVLLAQVGGVPAISFEDKQATATVLATVLGRPTANVVLVSENARGFLERRFDFERLSDTVAGGEPCYRLMRREASGLGGRSLTPFVGRDTELAIVAGRLGQAGEGHGQVVAVVGETGVGKSRLIHEVTVAPEARGWRVLASSGVSYGTATPFLPFGDLLRRYFAVEDGDSPARVHDKVTRTITRLPFELGPHVTPLLALLDVPIDHPKWQGLDPSHRRLLMLDAVKLLLLAESRLEPLIVVFEDLHWIDAHTQSLLDGLVDGLPTARIVLVVSFRPEYVHSWGGKTYYTQIRIDPLQNAGAATLLQGLLGSEPALRPLAQLLIDRTEGNPLFLEECVQALADAGALVGERGAYRMAAPIETIQVPPTVQAVLAARIDRLPFEDKRLLQSAAVIGRRLSFSLLAAIAERPEEDLRRELGRLTAAEFLYEKSLFPALEYTFKHALTHEVVYAGVPHEPKRALHARIVEVLETFPTEHSTEQLAHHAFRGELWDKAVGHLRQAGRRAFQRSAYREAVALFDQALAALGHLPESRERAIQLRFDLHSAFFTLGQFDRMLDNLREAEALAAKLDDQRQLGWVSAYMAHVLWQMGRVGEAERSGRRAQAIAESSGDLALQVSTNFHLGQTCFFSGEYRVAADFFRKNVQSLAGDLSRERIGLTFYPAPTSHAYMAVAFGERGRFDEAAAHGNEAIRLADEVDHPVSRVVAHWCLGDVHRIRGEFDAAISQLERGLALARQFNLTLLSPRVTGSLGYAYACVGRVAEGLDTLQDTRRTFEAMGTGVHHWLVLVHLGEILIRAGRVEEAQACAERALAATRGAGLRGQEAYSLHLRADVAARTAPANVDLAERYYRQALELARVLEMRPLVARCYLGLAALARPVGSRADAEEQLDAARAMFREMGMRFWLEQAERPVKEAQ